MTTADWIDDEMFDSPLMLRELMCAERGHMTLAPTGASMICLRCNKTIDGLGLDDTLDRQRREEGA